MACLKAWREVESRDDGLCEPGDKPSLESEDCYVRCVTVRPFGTLVQDVNLFEEVSKIEDCVDLARPVDSSDDYATNTTAIP